MEGSLTKRPRLGFGKLMSLLSLAVNKATYGEGFHMLMLFEVVTKVNDKVTHLIMLHHFGIKEATDFEIVFDSGEQAILNGVHWDRDRTFGLDRLNGSCRTDTSR